MKTRRILFYLFIILSFCMRGLILSAQHTDNSLVVPEKRAVWIQSAVIKLENAQSDTSFNLVEIQEISFEDYFRLKVRIIGSGKWILPGKNRIFFITYSSHENPEVGDITLAIDHRGRMYQNSGHVCGGIISFETGEIKKVKSSRQFFRHFVSDTDGERWKRMD